VLAILLLTNEVLQFLNQEFDKLYKVYVTCPRKSLPVESGVLS
jgi:hypothetical protein